VTGVANSRHEIINEDCLDLDEIPMNGGMAPLLLATDSYFVRRNAVHSHPTGVRNSDFTVVSGVIQVVASRVMAQVTAMEYVLAVGMPAKMIEQLLVKNPFLMLADSPTFRMCSIALSSWVHWHQR
jgi:hypothetical protein